MRFPIAGLVALAMAASSPAHADWQVAESDHFVIYADDSAKDVRRFAHMLESFHSAMEVATGRRIEKPSPSNRVTIYAGRQRARRPVAGGDQVAGSRRVLHPAGRRQRRVRAGLALHSRRTRRGDGRVAA